MGIDINPKIYDIPLVKGKRILLVVDTTYTGVTLTKVMKLLIEICEAKTVKAMVMWMEGKFSPDYFYRTKRVPIMWEWGSEID